MLIACLRVGLLLAMLVASIRLAAETRYWTLNGVQFEDGAVATGYFSLDDATGNIATWNVRVSGGAGPFMPWTFVPGNSHIIGALDVYSYTPDLDRATQPGAASFWWRELNITPLVPFDSRSTMVPIDLCHDCPPAPYPSGRTVEYFSDDNYALGSSRKITAGSFVPTPVPPPVTIVQVDEFYHPGLRHYFLTADAAEKELLDTGIHRGWERTGESFKAYAAGSPTDGSVGPVCRYYGNPERGLDSHFYSAAGKTQDPPECVSVFAKFGSAWVLESDNAFQIHLPDTMTGACPAGTVPVYRVWNQRDDSNHRYTTSVAIKAQMIAGGYAVEGYGPDGVVMCAVR